MILLIDISTLLYETLSLLKKEDEYTLPDKCGKIFQALDIIDTDLLNRISNIFILNLDGTLLSNDDLNNFNLNNATFNKRKK
ncbi:MAG: hypothetical protein IPM14_05200 [bacterium]|nr:hypothetical protein [bacterium]